LYNMHVFSFLSLAASNVNVKSSVSEVRLWHVLLTCTELALSHERGASVLMEQQDIENCQSLEMVGSACFDGALVSNC
jgi:hypothetical protein